jgi:hypothetical protein
MILREVDISSLGLMMVDDPSRSKGLHLSDIISDMMQALYPDKYGGEKDDVFTARVEFGLMWERTLESALARECRLSDEELERPPEQECDGIYMSPDGFALFKSNGGMDMRVNEYKSTWKSAPSEKKGTTINDPKFMAWWMQLKAYCRAAGTTHGRLIVYFINGDYSQGFVPELRAWDAEFTQEELDLNWQSIVNHARAKGML